MKASRNQLIMMAVLGVVLVAVFAYQFILKPSGAADTPRTPAGEPTTPVSSASALSGEEEMNIEDLMGGIKEVDFDYERERLARDPLKPVIWEPSRVRRNGEGDRAVERLGPLVEWAMQRVVSGIIWDPTYPVAVVSVDNEIDDRVVYPGYRYSNGVVVDRIEQDRVVFRVGDSVVVAQLEGAVADVPG